MKQQTDTMIVLSRINYGEADRINTVLSKAGGKITLIAKGARKQKSKLAGGIELFSENEITYATGKKGMGTLMSSRMQKLFSDIVKNYEVSQDVFAILNWLNKHLEDDTGTEYYGLLVESLELANTQNRHADSAYVWFFTRALELSGHGIEVFRGQDGNKLEPADRYTFDHDQACFLVKEDGLYEKEHIKLLRVLTSVDFSQYLHLNVSTATVEGTRSLLERHLVLTF